MAAENIAIIASWFEWRSVAAAARAAEPSCCWSMANMALRSLWRFDAAPCAMMLTRPSMLLLLGGLPGNGLFTGSCPAGRPWEAAHALPSSMAVSHMGAWLWPAALKCTTAAAAAGGAGRGAGAGAAAAAVTSDAGAGAGAGVVNRSHSWLCEVPCGWVVGHDTQQNVKPADDTIADARSHPVVQHIVRRAREANARALG